MIWVGDIAHGALIARVAKTGFDLDVDMCISRVCDGEFLGGFILTNYNGAICFVHMAGKHPRWCSPELMWVMFDHAFNRMQVKRMLCTVGSKNERALQQVRRAGWRSEHRILGGTPDGDLLIFSMARDHCRWLGLTKRFFKTNSNHPVEDVYARA